MQAILEYHPETVEELRRARALPNNVDDAAMLHRISDQIDAADRAFLRAGMHRDGSHRNQVQGFHPMFHALRENTHSRTDRKNWIQAIRADMWDAVCVLTTFFHI
jgi:hypothetical protein